MQTTLTIEDSLFNEAAQIAETQNKNEIVATALREYIENHKRAKKANMLDLYGVGGIREDYDYKALRCNGEN